MKLLLGVGAGTLAGSLTFLACYWMASLPAVTVASTSWAFRPWWRLSNWMFSLGVAVISVVLVMLSSSGKKKR